MENVGILDVFHVFHTVPVGQKIRCPANAELFRVSLYYDLGMAADDDGCAEDYTVLRLKDGYRLSGFSGSPASRALVSPDIS